MSLSVILQLAHGLHIDPRALFEDALAAYSKTASTPKSEGIRPLKSAVSNPPRTFKHGSTLREPSCPPGDLTTTGAPIEKPHPRKEY
jgi:hypothetical protein